MARGDLCPVPSGKNQKLPPEVENIGQMRAAILLHVEDEQNWHAQHRRQSKQDGSEHLESTDLSSDGNDSPSSILCCPWQLPKTNTRSRGTFGAGDEKIHVRRAAPLRGGGGFIPTWVLGER